MGMLQITVAAGDSGPVVRLSGECDLSVTGQLSDALNAQIAGGQQHLTVDLSGLRFADSACIRVLMKAHLALTDRGGTLELAFPQPIVATVLRLLGVDQRLPVRMQPSPGEATDLRLWMVTGPVSGACQ
jgi:anti-anti-sigma factor